MPVADPTDVGQKPDEQPLNNNGFVPFATTAVETSGLATSSEDEYSGVEVVSNVVEKPFFARFVDQLFVMLSRNTTLQIRYYRSTILQAVLAPLFFMLLLYVLQLGGYSNQRRSNPYPPTGDLGFLQNCQGRSPGDPCINLMFTPNVEPYTTFVKSMIELNKERSKNTNSTNWLIEDPLSDTNFLPSRALGAVPVPSADFIYDYTLKHRNVTKWGIVFNKTETPASAPGGASTNFQYQVWFNGSQSGNGTDYFGRQALTLVTLLDSAIISYTNDPSGTKYVRVNPRMQDWPRLPPDQIADTVVQNLGTVFFFCATMVIFINVVNQIVNEKELKLRAGMEMMGLIPSAYWISHFLSNSVIIFVSSLISCLLGLAFQFSVFKQSSFAVPFITFFLFGEAMVMFAFFITTLVRSARVGVLISIFLFIIGLVFEGFVFSNTQFAYIWWDSGTDRAGWLCFMFFPPFNFGKMFTDLNVLTTGKLDQLTSTYIAGAGFPWSALYDPVPDSQLPVYGSGNPPDVPPPIQSWYFLIMNCAFFGILTWYLDAVVPTEYGSVYPPWFFLTPNYWGLSRRRTGAKDGEAEWLEEILAEKVKSFTGDDEEEEDDVAHERKRALDPNYVPAVKIVNLRKAYGSGNKSKIALRSLALTFHEGKCLAVVGQNGAGKTSAINILCGLTPATGGDALMYGLSVKHDMSRIRKLMGVCPQHDILFDDLTAREHITLYARLKGVPIEQLPALIEARLKAVRLWKVADQRAGAFSGGMKRRLSMVISTIGDPKVIFMDEPTTGMDPVNRRKVWQFIEKFKANRVIVLTTHAMEEAEVLGDQIAIMAAGRMRAIGNPIALKSKYGAGYRMSLLTDPARLEEAKTAVATVAPEAELEDDAAGALIYRLPPDAAETGVVPRFIKWLDSTEGSSVIKSWGISQTSLEEVFLRLLRDGGLDVFKKVREQQLKNANADAASTQVSVPIPPEASIPAQRKSYQLRALARKTLAYQSRQWFTNICCITLCPLVMVVIASLLGIVVRQLIANQLTIEEYLYCSSLDAMDPATNWPYTNILNTTVKGLLPVTDRSSIPDAQTDTVRHLNVGPPPSAGTFSTANYPCVRWFGTNQYPYSSLYERDPGRFQGGYENLDSTYTAQPKGGWLGVLALARLQTVLNQLQTRPNFIYTYNTTNGVGPEMLGVRERTDPIDLLSNPRALLTAVRGTPAHPTYKSVNGSTSVFDTIEGRLYVGFEKNSSVPGGYSVGLQPVPWFTKIGDDNAAIAALDDNIGSTIKATIAKLSTLNKTVLTAPSDQVTTEDFVQFYADVGKVVNDVPYGGVHFDVLDFVNGVFNYTMVIGSDGRLERAATFAPAGLRQVILQSQLSNAILRKMNSTFYGSSSITQGFRSMPEFRSTAISLPIGSLVGRFLFPFGVSFLLPIFVITLVKEKEDRILVMMQMNGLKSITYYLTHYAHFYTLHVLSSIVFLLTGLAMQMEMFTRTDWLVFLVIFFLWGHAQIAIAFFFSALFSRSRVALVTTFLIVLCSVVVYLASDFLFTDRANPAFFIWPPFAFYRILGVINTASYTSNSLAFNIRTMWNPFTSEIPSAIIVMFIMTIVLLLLAGYLESVLPSEYGVPKPWHWPVSYPFLALTGKGRDGTPKKKKGAEVSNMSGLILPPNPEELELEDEDVKLERARVLADEYDKASPVVMKGMRKEYSGKGTKKLAVKDVTFAVEDGIVFGLLGNGAGKTTLISILTGLYNATAGQARLASYDIVTERAQVWNSIGVCPQHDILWDDLTVEEHLLFYARLKGIPKDQEREAVQHSMETVSLETFARRLSRGLSGGEKRRLSIAIGLVGSPKVVFLDEPTTGLDPEVRRLIWNIINDAKKGKTVILTTHSMEEAEVCCQRIGIMAKGILRCHGPQLRLKQVYGSGFKLFFSAKPSDLRRAAAFVESALPQGWKKVDSFATLASYEFVPDPPGIIASLFETIEAGKREHGVEDWGLSQTSLEDVFLKICGEAEIEASL